MTAFEVVSYHNLIRHGFNYLQSYFSKSIYLQADCGISIFVRYKSIISDESFIFLSIFRQIKSETRERKRQNKIVHASRTTVEERKNQTNSRKLMFSMESLKKPPNVDLENENWCCFAFFLSIELWFALV